MTGSNSGSSFTSELLSVVQHRRGWLITVGVVVSFCVVAFPELAIATSQVRLLIVLALLLIVAAISLHRRTFPFQMAILLLPFMGWIRRITAGPGAYVANDPFNVVVPALFVLACLVNLSPAKKRPTPQTWAAYGALAVLAGGLGALRFGPIAIYTASLAVAPLALAVTAMKQRDHTMLATLTRITRYTAPLVSIYGVIQYYSPPNYDLNWLTTQHAVLTSVGEPIAEHFRIWSTTESPGVLAAFLGVYIVIEVSQLSKGALLRTTVYRLPSLTVAVWALLLTQTRTVIFGLVATAVIYAVVTLKGRRLFRLLLILGLSAGVLVLLPRLAITQNDSTSPGGSYTANRFDVASLSGDRSYNARLQLLGQIPAGLENPVGSGFGSTFVGAQSLDNGYIVVLLEQGPVSLLLLIAIAIRAIAKCRTTDIEQDDDHLRSSAGLLILLTVIQLSGALLDEAVAVYFWLPAAWAWSRRNCTPAAQPETVDLMAT